jgi:hypothetical protein
MYVVKWGSKALEIYFRPSRRAITTGILLHTLNAARLPQLDDPTTALGLVKRHLYGTNIP